MSVYDSSELLLIAGATNVTLFDLLFTLSRLLPFPTSLPVIFRVYAASHHASHLIRVIILPLDSEIFMPPNRNLTFNKHDNGPDLRFTQKYTLAQPYLWV